MNLRSGVDISTNFVLINFSLNFGFYNFANTTDLPYNKLRLSLLLRIHLQTQMNLVLQVSPAAITCLSVKHKLQYTRESTTNTKNRINTRALQNTATAHLALIIRHSTISINQFSNSG